jgi:RNA polymerase sigma factor (sigma-70 family)
MNIALSLEREEKQFLAACISKERWAQKKLYEDHYGLLMGVCLRYSNNQEDARDILHEGFIKIFSNISKYRPGTSLAAWMRRIMVNTAIDYYRKAIRRRTDDLDHAGHLDSDLPDAASQVGEKEILAAVQRLSPVYRTVFNLYVVEGFSHREIADALGITESTSRSNLVKARMKLQEILTPLMSKHEK